MLPPYVMIDLAIAGVLAVCVLAGRKRGLFGSLTGFAVVIVALLAAGKAADVGTDFVIERFVRPAATAAMEQRVDELLLDGAATLSPAEEMEQVIGAIPSDFVREKAAELLKQADLSAVTGPTRETLLALGGSLLDTVLDTAVRGVLHGAIYLAAFLVAAVVLKLVARALNLTMKLPVLRQANQLGGLLFGAAEGVALVGVGVLLLSRLSPWITPETVEQSILLKIAAGWLKL